ncbi:MAG TPA: PLP-dependent aminotransferase family protein, partial [Acidimicrobiales bacterium]|nr:PLP-dependent aminotransferase family protein [Acidimicrobiales bacterium]
PRRPLALSPATFARVLAGWTDDPPAGPLYRRLAAAVIAAVDRGDIPRTARLPAERAAARALGVSRGTVVAGYDLLADTGLVDRRRGSGTWVGDGAAPELRMRELDAGLRARQLTRDTVVGGDDVIDLALSVLPTPDDLPPEALHLDAGELARVAHGHGYHPGGLPALRARIAGFYTDLGVPTGADQVVVTVGAQQAIALTARLLVQPGDAVAVESPTYPGAIDVYSRAGARFVTVAGDAGGVVPDDLARAVATARPRLVYVVPTGHNPRGTVLPDQRRRQVAAVVDGSDTWLAEDECLAWCAYDGDRPPLPIAAHGSGERVLTVGSISKLAWGGLRVGWLRGPAPAMARVARLKAALDVGNCAVSQAMALTVFDRVDEIAAARRRHLAGNARLLCRLLAAALPGWHARPPDGGLSLWVRLPSGTADAFAPVALRHGVRVLPGSAASPDEAHLDHLRLTVALAPERLRRAVDRLAAAWADHTAAGAPALAVPVTAG